MNTAVMFSSKTDQWATPQDFFNKCNEEFNFDLDACATAENAKVKNYFTPEQDSLKQDWTKYRSIWINPPYGRAMPAFIEKAWRTIEQNRTDDRHAYSSKDGHKSFSRFYLSQSGNPFY